ncbi:uncharacterized protein LOC131945852 [Physella acuta]|uniref:uncharacterized protein LOC131945852 n=1 Tax=Physella acuta TaxID=109671 RepID=UPI0027DADD7C|nr:uncharacterized protein LOC131945852 [Physella acuta]
MNDPPKELDLVLIGKTGNGKSATGNSVLNKENAFTEGCDFSSKTRFPEYDACDFLNYRIQVVDCPGVFDTELSKENGVMMVHAALQTAVIANPKGYHAFLVVVKYGNRFLEEDKTTIMILKNILGSDFLKNYGVLVLTNGDSLSLQTKKTGLSLNDFCNQQTGYFKTLLEECQGRAVVFNNVTTDDETKNDQRKKLIEIVESLNTNGRRYTNGNFLKAQQLYKQILDENQGVMNKDFINKQSCILDQICKKESKHDKSGAVDMKNLLKEIIELESHLAKTDKKSVKSLLTNLEQAQYIVEKKIKELENPLPIMGQEITKKSKESSQASEISRILINFQEIKKNHDKGFFSSLEIFVQQPGHQIFEICINQNVSKS